MTVSCDETSSRSPPVPTGLAVGIGINYPPDPRRQRSTHTEDVGDGSDTTTPQRTSVTTHTLTVGVDEVVALDEVVGPAEGDGPEAHGTLDGGEASVHSGNLVR